MHCPRSASSRGPLNGVCRFLEYPHEHGDCFFSDLGVSRRLAVRLLVRNGSDDVACRLKLAGHPVS
eukprot:10143860-Lingulodinium_polyedra.AAC.1